MAGEEGLAVVEEGIGRAEGVVGVVVGVIGVVLAHQVAVLFGGLGVESVGVLVGVELG